ncbi:DUF4276 family protein [Saccharothrix longispora]|uniref:DUF4276 family protein n=1 Tax=Saccharothrix longispora TaxID=33920 RepID=UPI0028FD41C2|nr:DUF4276 family protein [Saccharothrix longispora]MDU0289470.1 DUF4276 family protein [Saccharothrix longispora]
MTRALRRLHLLVEGQTEEVVADLVIRPHLERLGWTTSLSLVKTKRPAAGPAHKGGITGWRQVERDVRLLLNDTSLDVLTTLFDYYAFPDECPGMADRPPGDVYRRVEHVERCLAEVVGDRRFRPNLVLHELEAWVFAAADELGLLLGVELAERLKRDVAAAGGPELVNDGPATAPSKRLLAYCPTYLKTSDGPIAVEELGVARLRAVCPHLDAWLRTFEE